MPQTALVALLVCIASAIPSCAQDVAKWRQATESELKNVIPARAPVEKEHIETETRTASGVTDGKGKFIAGAVLITAGYSAEGKYSHFLVAQVPLKIGEVSLAPGEYVLGFKHEGDSISVSLYEAQSGKPLGSVRAERLSRMGRIESFHIFPPSEHSVIAIGRFGFSYQIAR
jgi:hypothetical protein